MAKNRNKSVGCIDKPPVTQLDEFVKKIPKVNKAESGRNSDCSSGKLGKCASALFYFILVAGGAFASFYLQKMLTEVKQLRLESEESLLKNAEMVKKTETSFQQVNLMKSSLEALESTVGQTHAELENTNRAVRKGEAETRKVEEVLQKLQNEILHDLSEGIREVKQAREHDFSSLEQTLEDRLADLSRSITDSVVEFTGAQGQTQAQLSELKARLEEKNKPGILKDELLSITATLENLQTASEVADGNVGILREQIASVGEELQTRNKEVSSLAEEIEEVRALIQSTAGLLRQEVASVQANMHGISDQVQNLRDDQERASKDLQSLEADLREELAKAEKREDEMEARLKSTEDNIEALAYSTAEHETRAEALLAKYDSHESSIAGQSQVAEKARQALREELQGLRESLQDVQDSISEFTSSNYRLEALSAVEATEEPELPTDEPNEEEMTISPQDEDGVEEEEVVVEEESETNVAEEDVEVENEITEEEE